MFLKNNQGTKRLQNPWGLFEMVTDFRHQMDHFCVLNTPSTHTYKTKLFRDVLGAWTKIKVIKDYDKKQIDKQKLINFKEYIKLLWAKISVIPSW